MSQTKRSRSGCTSSGVAQNRMFVMNRQQVDEDLNVIIGTSNAFGYLALVLIDSDAYSYLSHQFARIVNVQPTPLDHEFRLSILTR